MKKAESSIQGERTISVSWQGGGDIKPEGASDWTIDALKEAAFNFPAKVANVPQRTYAIITKYTALRSYQEQASLGTPMDYEIAGVYTSSLLEAYLEYKSIWKEIQLMTWDVEHDLKILQARPHSSGMEQYAKCLKDCHDAAATAKPTDTTTNAKPDTSLKPNPVQPYGADLFGLDTARTDCRFEMIKIVREVDAVTLDPKVAIDSSRINRFLNPSIFRLLVPKALPPPPQEPAGTLYVSAVGRALWSGDRSQQHKRFLEALPKHANLAGSFQYSSEAAGDLIDSGAEFQTSLDFLTREMPRPTRIILSYMAEGFIDAISMDYGPTRAKLCTSKNDAPSQDLDCRGKVTKISVGMNTYNGAGSGFELTGLKVWPENQNSQQSGTATRWFDMSAPAGMSLRGFAVVKGSYIDKVNAIWGVDPL